MSINMIMELHGLADAIQRDTGRLATVCVNHFPATQSFAPCVKVMVTISDYRPGEEHNHIFFEGDSLVHGSLEELRTKLGDWLVKRRKQIKGAA